tara:strand:+ start:1340 stop:1951 length:612 start_codon:yes stop_codon:yes gene_type:complete
MEGIEAEIENKSIEKSVEIKVVEAEPKPRKPRSQAQKDAFEKARKKRAENLLKKKTEEEAVAPEPVEAEEIKPPPASKPKKTRGRPKKLTKNQELQAQSFIPPPDPQLYSQYPYQVQNQAQPQFNPYQYWGGGIPPQQAQAPQPAPVNNYYYYGTPPQEEKKVEFVEAREPEPSPNGSIEYEYEEEEEIEYPEEASQLKYRFA